jgi:hypothetical protein
LRPKMDIFGGAKTVRIPSGTPRNLSLVLRGVFFFCAMRSRSELATAQRGYPPSPSVAQRIHGRALRSSLLPI